MSACRRRARDCDIAVWFEGQCGAVAADAAPTKFFGLGASLSAARSLALTRCVPDGRKVCTVFQPHCSWREVSAHSGADQHPGARSAAACVRLCARPAPSALHWVP